VTNSRDAMPEGGTIDISTFTCELKPDLIKEHRGLQPGRYAAIMVRDSGVGMDRETREKIFEPFFTTKETGKGTGLGLAIVYGIISQHNGFIDVKSTAGKGTTVTVHLPLLDSLTASPAVETQTFIPFDQGGAETILLAEDNDDARNVFREVLEGAGYRVITAVDGNDAVDAFKRHAGEVSMVILDVVMPRKNGSQVLDEIRALRPDVKYLFSSGYTADIIHVKGKLEPGLHFLAKPAIPNELLSKVREILDEQGG
jgi:CheY-like chemotaxis protein